MYRKYFQLLLRGKTDVVNACNQLNKESKVLDQIIDIIKNLKRGKVDPKDTKRRSKVGSYFSSEAQQILYYIFRHKIDVEHSVKENLRGIVEKGEAVLRENIVLQSKSPIDVIKFANVPVRYAYSQGRREQRCGWGLHKSPTTEQGYSVSLAFMPPRYCQVFHMHQVAEYSLALDGKTIGYPDAGDKRKKITACKKEVLYFHAGVVHTLYNPRHAVSRNITFKSPKGLLDRREYNDNHMETHGHRSRIIKGILSQLGIGGSAKETITIQDSHYNYQLEIIDLHTDDSIVATPRKDRYFFVVDGKLTVSHKRLRRFAHKNDFIVIDKNTDFRIKAHTNSTLYTVNLNH